MHPLCRTAVRALVALSLLPVPSIVGAAEDGLGSAQPHLKKRHAQSTSKPASTSKGKASYYARSLAGRKTASGERYDPDAMTAAHRTLPLGTQLKITNPKNDKSVVVTVNDRGPVPRDRVVDVSSAAAKELGMTKSGTAHVETEVVGKDPAVAK